ncbi:unnamed protein product [Cylicostephanus goldi]|uniref:Endonuclease/exonuclease/phosphatase domain-containing protein n=1 Tax=Cylicostephanus goldi TaxID=71465 RepID=A0A3P6T2B0_CYLGO|nr:unnamed protein product [Cylicostephanus goldi]
MEEVLQHPEISRWLNDSDLVPFVLAGDFNSPSHLDWTSETRKDHGGWVIDWPATKIAEDAGLQDSFRILHPSVIDEPGNTWSTVNKFMAEWEYQIPEPQDRIDYILYKGNIFPIGTILYSGRESLRPMPDHRENDYPSDHYALITDFEFTYSERCSICS